MSTQVAMPRLSDTMEEGLVIAWLRKSGDHVDEGDPIASIETDKAIVELAAASSGTIYVLVDEGQSAEVGATLAYLGTPDELAELQVVRQAKREAGPPAGPRQAGASDPSEQNNNASGSPSAQDDGPAPHRVRATPIARRMALEAGIDLLSIGPGSGPRGRIHKVDVERVLRSEPEPHRLPTSVSMDGMMPIGPLIPRGRIVELVAKRMVQAKREIPHFYLSITVDCHRAMRLRKKLATSQSPAKITFTDLVIQASARALRASPEVNSSWEDDGIRRHPDVNVGFAVALDDGGLVVPVIRGADELTLAELTVRRAELVQRARTRTIAPDELSGGTFTVSNLGMFGVDEFHAIINPPESAILAVGAVHDRLVSCHGRPVARPVVKLSLSADHRLYSGATAATFLAAVRAGLEEPLLMLAGFSAAVVGS